MMDGENTISGNSTHNMSNFTGYGYLAKARLGTSDAATAVTRLDQKTARGVHEHKGSGHMTLHHRVSGDRADDAGFAAQLRHHAQSVLFLC